MPGESLLFLGLLAAGLLPLGLAAWRSRSRRMALAVIGLLGVCAVSALSVARLRAPVVAERAIDNRPRRIAADGYVTSDTCRSCHAQQYETWRRSYHSTMTQVPTRETVPVQFDAVDLQYRGQRFRLERRGDDFGFVQVGGGGQERVERPVVMTTGSHHMQVFWYATGHSQEIATTPFVYLVEERQWIPYDATFVAPPSRQIHDDKGLWPKGCIRCHTTHGRPGFRPPDGFSPEASEFGIACEACHGPGQGHVRANHDPRVRYRQHLGPERDGLIVHPPHLSPVRSSQVCGQCHGVWVSFDEEDPFYSENGYRYRPGDDIRRTRLLFDPNSANPRIQQIGQRNALWVRGAFWPDGTARVTGREYHGLVDSPCYAHGDEQKKIISCFSCHTMHQALDDPRHSTEWANDQLKPGMAGDPACLQCHSAYDGPAAIAAHTHHAPDSSGSRCYNCHMPYSTYGLLSAIRSHRIENPTVRVSQETARPNGCNACHLDRTLAWTADHLERWYGTPRPDLTADERSVAASLLWSLRGDAGQRALVACLMRWDAALSTSGTKWVPLILIQLLDDPYAAVRFNAYRSLHRLPGYQDLAFDLTDSVGDRRSSVKTAIQIFKHQLASLEHFPTGDAILIGPRREIRADVITRLVLQRDDTPIALQE